MGLDLYAHGVNESVFADVPRILCGSMFTDGVSSIRGKRYAEFILDVCDVSLYQEKVPMVELNKIITKLSVYINEQEDCLLSISKFNYISEEETRALLKWFQLIKDNNGFVMGWW